MRGLFQETLDQTINLIVIALAYQTNVEVGFIGIEDDPVFSGSDSAPRRTAL